MAKEIRVRAIRQPDGSYEQRYVDMCKKCRGKGYLQFYEKVCDVCEGSGRVVIFKTINVQIEPFPNFDNNEKNTGNTGCN